MAVLLSMIVHLLLLLILALWVRTSNLPASGLELTASQGTQANDGLEELSSFEIAPPAEQLMVEPAAAAEPTVELAYEMEPLFGPPASDSGDSAASLLSLEVGDAVDTLSEGGKEGASFFGSYAEGKRFVYVLDSSRSMHGDRWLYACNELIDSLNALKPEQEFFVICFDLKTSFLFNKPPGKADYQQPKETTVAQVRKWLRGRTLGRATMPADALRAALAMEPDAIFLLSDGELQDNSLLMLRQLNGGNSLLRQVPVHTIHLFSPFGRESLELIAMENGGTFTHVGQ